MWFNGIQVQVDAAGSIVSKGTPERSRGTDEGQAKELKKNSDLMDEKMDILADPEVSGPFEPHVPA